MRTTHHIAIEVDRALKLSLSNYEFEVLVEVLNDSQDPQQTSLNMIACGARVVMYVLNLSKEAK